LLLFSKSSVAVALFPINVIVVGVLLMPIITVTVVVFMPIIIVVVIVFTSINFIVVVVFLPIILVIVFQAIRVVDGELVGRAGEPERDDFERRF